MWITRFFVTFAGIMKIPYKNKKKPFYEFYNTIRVIKVVGYRIVLK